MRRRRLPRPLLVEFAPNGAHPFMPAAQRVVDPSPPVAGTSVRARADHSSSGSQSPQTSREHPCEGDGQAVGAAASPARRRPLLEFHAGMYRSPLSCPTFHRDRTDVSRPSVASAEGARGQFQIQAYDQRYSVTQFPRFPMPFASAKKGVGCKAQFSTQLQSRLQHSVQRIQLTDCGGQPSRLQLSDRVWRKGAHLVELRLGLLQLQAQLHHHLAGLWSECLGLGILAGAKRALGASRPRDALRGCGSSCRPRGALARDNRGIPILSVHRVVLDGSGHSLPVNFSNWE